MNSWTKVIGASAGLLATGLSVALYARHRSRQPKRVGADTGTPERPPLFLVDLKVTPWPEEVDPQGGEIVRDMNGGIDHAWIDERQILLGPLLQEIPEGHRMLVEIELKTKPEPPAIPGAPWGPCYAYFEYFEVGHELGIHNREISYPAECERLQKTASRDWDVSFPSVRIVRRPDGIFLRYNWIKFGHPQDGNIYYARDYTVTLRWKIV